MAITNKVAQGQLTIVDLHDMPPVQARLSSNLGKIFVKGKDGSITPPLSGSISANSGPLNIYVEVYQAGNQTNIAQIPNSALGELSNIQWEFFRSDGSQIDPREYPSLGITKLTTEGGVNSNYVQISKNSTLDPGLKVSATASYKYTGIKSTTTVAMDIDFSTIYSGVDGVDAFTVLLTNSSHIFPVASNGTLEPGVNVSTTAEMYQGTKKLDKVTISLAPGGGDSRFDIALSGDTATITTKQQRMRTSGSSATDNGVIPFDITSAESGNEKFRQDFSWAVSSKGVDGQSATSYWLDVSDSVIIKSFNDSNAAVVTPNLIKLKAMRQIGENPVQDWTATATIKAYENGATQASTVSNGQYAVTTNTKSLKFELLANNVVVDSETVRVIQEQKEPVVMAVQADSDTIRNNQGSVTIKAVIYKNGVDFTEQAGKKWYRGTETTAIANQTGSSLVVNAADVQSSQIYRCKATVAGVEYSDSITIWDVSDPITVELRSSGGNIFQNGQGETTLQCILWRNGAEIDSNGSEYKYIWKKLDQNGEVTSDTFNETKSIKVSSSQVDKKATFVCEVSMK